MDLLRIAQATERLTTDLDQQRISVHPERCLNLRDKTLGCSRCQQACPVDAIALEPEPRLEDDRCVRCGACLHRCPTGVFAGTDDRRDLLACVENLTDRDHLELVCDRNSMTQASSPRTQAVVRIQRCLASLAPSVFISLKALGVKSVITRTEACKQCALRRAQSTIEQSLAEAQNMLTAWGEQDSISASSSMPAKTVKRPVFSARNPPMSRRGFFSHLSGGKSGRIQEVMAADERSKPGMPRERRYLLAAMRCLPPPPGGTTNDRLPLVELSAGDDCAACGLCERVCPTMALRLSASDDRFALDFDAARCVDCRLCLKACPSQTLRRDPEPCPHEWLQVVPRTIASGVLKRCRKCRAPFAADGDLCPSCQRRRLNPFGC